MSRIMCAPRKYELGVMKKWTIQVFYNARDDKGKQFRATCCYQGEAPDQASFIKQLDKIDWSGYDTIKFGAMLPGWHPRIP